jgi:hypothetical protein
VAGTNQPMSDPSIGTEQGGMPSEFVDTPDSVRPGDERPFGDTGDDAGEDGDDDAGEPSGEVISKR